MSNIAAWYADSDVAEIVRITGDIDRRDAAVARLERDRVHRAIRLADDEAGETVDRGGARPAGNQRRLLAGEPPRRSG
jgi:hypothetical protein